MKADWCYHKGVCSNPPPVEEVVDPLADLKRHYIEWLKLAKTNLSHLTFSLLGFEHITTHACMITVNYFPEMVTAKFQLVENMAVKLSELKSMQPALYARLQPTDTAEISIGAPILLRIRMEQFLDQELIMIPDFRVTDSILLEHGAMPASGMSREEYRKLLIEFCNLGTFTGASFEPGKA